MKNGDTQKMKAISEGDLKDKANRSKAPANKMSGFGKFINAFGLVLLVVMLTYVGVNFARDARVFQKPLLTADAGKKDNSSSTTTSDSIGTYKYKKPVTKSTSGTKNNTSNSGKNSSGPKKTVTPTPTPNP